MTWTASGCDTTLVFGALDYILHLNSSTAQLGTHDDQHAWTWNDREQTNGPLKTERDYVQMKNEQHLMGVTEQTSKSSHARGEGM